jgi:hypothetical protein
MTTAARKEKLLEDERALNQTEAATVLGCRPRDVSEYMQPSFYLGSKPKYIAREVLKVRDRMVAAAQRVKERNIRMVQNALAFF